MDAVVEGRADGDEDAEDAVAPAVVEAAESDVATDWWVLTPTHEERDRNRGGEGGSKGERPRRLMEKRGGLQAAGACWTLCFTRFAIGDLAEATRKPMFACQAEGARQRPRKQPAGSRRSKGGIGERLWLCLSSNAILRRR